MSDDFEDFITPALHRLATQVPAACTAAAQDAARRCADTLRRNLPRAKKVLPSDVLEGFTPPSVFIAVQPMSDGSEVRIAPFYGSLTAALREAITAAGTQAKLDRVKLTFHKKGKAGQKGDLMTVDFTKSARLEEWARQHYQHEHRSVVVDSPAEVAPWVVPAVDVARVQIYRDATLAFTRAVEGR